MRTIFKLLYLPELRPAQVPENKLGELLPSGNPYQDRIRASMERLSVPAWYAHRDQICVLVIFLIRLVVITIKGSITIKHMFRRIGTVAPRRQQVHH